MYNKDLVHIPYQHVRPRRSRHSLEIWPNNRMFSLGLSSFEHVYAKITKLLVRPVKTPITLGIQVGLVLIKDKKKKLSTSTLFNVDARRKNNVQNRHNLAFCNSHPENTHLTLTFHTCANVCSILCALQENISSGSFYQSLLKATLHILAIILIN